MPHYYIVKIESFEGRDVHLCCGDDHQDYLFCVIRADGVGCAEIVDNGYRSLDEAAAAWPQAASMRDQIPRP